MLLTDDQGHVYKSNLFPLYPFFGLPTEGTYLCLIVLLSINQIALKTTYMPTWIWTVLDDTVSYADFTIPICLVTWSDIQFICDLVPLLDESQIGLLIPYVFFCLDCHDKIRVVLLGRKKYWNLGNFCCSVQTHPDWQSISLRSANEWHLVVAALHWKIHQWRVPPLEKTTEDLIFLRSPIHQIHFHPNHFFGMKLFTFSWCSI